MFKTEKLHSDDNRQLCETVCARVTESLREWVNVEGDSLKVSKIKNCKCYVSNVLSNDFCTTLSTKIADFSSPIYMLLPPSG